MNALIITTIYTNEDAMNNIQQKLIESDIMIYRTLRDRQVEAWRLAERIRKAWPTHKILEENNPDD